MTGYPVRALALLTLCACSAEAPVPEDPGPGADDAEVSSPDDVEDVSPDMSGPTPRILVFTRTAGYRHDSIEPGVAALTELGDENGFEITATEDPATFSAEGLAPFAAVVFLSTTGDVLDDAQQAAFEAWFGGGRGFVGVHAAADTEYGWPFYGELVGAWFDSHPAIQEATVQVVDTGHPSSAGLPADWVRTDEWYNFRTNPGDAVNVIARLDESTYEGGNMGGDHPIAWYHETAGGRAFYTAGGHTAESFGEPLFRAHLAGAILWAAGLALP